MANTNLRETAFCLVGGLRKVEHTIQHCFTVVGVGESTTWDSPELLDKNCREVFDALRDCSVAFVKFREAFEPCQKDVSKHVGGYQLERPKGFLSHLTKLSKQSSVVLNSLADICNRGGDFRNWYVSNPPWLESDWWDSLKIQPRPQLDNLLDALQKRVEEYRPMIESITEGDFCENILQEIEVVELEFEPRNTPGDEIPIDENRTQNPQIKDGLSEDKRTLIWGGKSYPLGINASRLVEKLLEVYPRSLHQDYLKTNCEFDSDIRHIVRDGKLKAVIVRAVDESGKEIGGQYRLRDPR